MMLCKRAPKTHRAKKSSRGNPYLGYIFFFISTRQQPFLADLPSETRVLLPENRQISRIMWPIEKTRGFLFLFFSLTLYVIFFLRRTDSYCAILFFMYIQCFSLSAPYLLDAMIWLFVDDYYFTRV